MNRSDGDKSLNTEGKKRANKKKSSERYHVVPDSQSSAGSSGMQLFFKWFRKDDVRLHNSSVEQKQVDQVISECPNSVTSVDKPHEETSFDSVSQSQSNEAHSSSPSPSPLIEYQNLSKSSSCDSILSTATDGFAFVPPKCYEVIGDLSQSERVINPGPYTDSYKRRVAQRDRTRELDAKYELTLRRKYNLFSNIRCNTTVSGKDTTLTRDNQKSLYNDLSLPTTSNIAADGITTIGNAGIAYGDIKKHRRTVSDSFKDKKAGAYVHVKGKRKAPPPPSLTLENKVTSSRDHTTSATLPNSKYGTLSPGSTLSRKKRPAPLPPLASASNSISNTSLLEDKEIKAIIEGKPILQTPEIIMPVKSNPLQGICEERTPGGLTEEQKQQLIDNIRKVQAPPDFERPGEINPKSSFMITSDDVMKLEEIFISTNGTRSPIHDYLYTEAVGNSSKCENPASPISPRPWYKRQISGVKHQEVSIPFKKDIVLKTVDKRKNKSKVNPDLPEVGYCRHSLIESANVGSSSPKFNLFSRITEKSEITKNRDRDSEKRKSGIGIPSISELDREAAEIISKENALKHTEHKDMYFSAPEQLVKRNLLIAKHLEQESDNSACEPRSTKELISKFEATSAGVNKISLNTSFVPRKDYFGVDRANTSTPPSSVRHLPQQEITPISNDKNLLGLWPCPYCTLENPNWRIICEACERIKPYDKLSILEEPPLRPNFQLKKAVPEAKPSNQQHSAEEWDKKTERVLKYFVPQANPTVSNGFQNLIEHPKKSFGHAKMLASPKMGVKSLLNRVATEQSVGIIIHSDSVNTSNKFDDEKLNENIMLESPKIEPELPPATSNIYKVTSVEPNSKSVNIDEVRSARIARFSSHQEELKNDNPGAFFDACTPKHIQDMDDTFLEKEKERLREMIRAMNSKALADKYPVLQKPPTSNNSTKIESPLPQRKNGFVSAIPISTKSPKPLRRASPTITRKDTITPKEHSPVAAEPYRLGAVKKTFIKKSNDQKMNKLSECKIINQETNSASVDKVSTIPELVSGAVQDIGYEAMNEQQFEAKCTYHSDESDKQSDKLRQISNQLRSVQGVESFRNTLKYTGSALNKTNTITLNKLLKSLELAIEDGAHDRAAELAMDLAKMKVSLSVTRQSPNRSIASTANTSTEISLRIFIVDKSTRKGPFPITVTTFTTLAELKEQIKRNFGIPAAVQRWICDDRQISVEQKSLVEYGIYDNDRILHLYIVSKETKINMLSTTATSAGKVELQRKCTPATKTVQQHLKDKQTETRTTTVSDSEGDNSDRQNGLQLHDGSNQGAMALPTISEDSTRFINDIQQGWECPLCTLVNPPERPGCSACSEARPVSFAISTCYRNQDPFIPDESKRIAENDCQKSLSVQMRNSRKELRNDLNRVSSSRKSSDIFNILLDETKAFESQNKASQAKPNTADLLTTRHMQIPEQKNIVMTAFTSPNITRNKYRGVDNFNPNSYNVGSTVGQKLDSPVISTASPIVRAVLLKSDKAVKFGRNGLVVPENENDFTNHYMELVNLDSADLIANVEPFECPICFESFKAFEGIVLRDCLHSFCKQCLVNTINYSEEAEIRCPFMNKVYSCESVIQQREIKALVSKDMYEAHLAKSIRQAENMLENTFHCKTPNCRGWCIYEDNVNQFKCPVCTIVNCLTCRAIHDGLDCKQYQDRMNSDCDTNTDSKRTKAMLQEMVDKGNALMCPTCQVVMMKKWGCDWLKCSMCKTEICWVTRGPRWGPGGKGDISGGCRCGVDGKKCHPECNYCH
ncbi:uncharacterized protein LOC129730091 [Wyeomyia smithii]|uniref:uncharacterized protein LOC129730091 n=1 Tax=Wyeomyia smithii TaxID=174621 RepID=UPI002467B54F|nr:uncharacterized protein LOC129730091 [Wyeomyia smithii]XP_055545101.1 uncharacterized protein LOC129730091 [Wyeomyia smithii]XP_055545102.1 uncharacterized protein LOC129730091 [Wyeomyia smithii]XP_055545103.1 uncharacterized protein LOC129730091 [Wyeomyia smithii]XP_055545104.1 uncharacterized protein LOC129730091 [Wyeomyia smithii]XP_055545105.1 uncharacterized protein LOC129730091 [Wyeomyia smithii]XP_055545106.1 uncharacterized protein LOC129730091 [Wyeomyia smithii]XP_055545107.1 unc